MHFSVCCWLTEAIKPSPVIQWNFSLLFVALSSSYLVRIPMLVAFFSARVCWVRRDLSTAISALGYLTCFPRHNSTDVISPNLTRKEGAEKEREREREAKHSLSHIPQIPWPVTCTLHSKQSLSTVLLHTSIKVREGSKYLKACP